MSEGFVKRIPLIAEAAFIWENTQFCKIKPFFGRFVQFLSNIDGMIEKPLEPLRNPHALMNSNSNYCHYATSWSDIWSDDRSSFALRRVIVVEANSPSSFARKA